MAKTTTPPHLAALIARETAKQYPTRTKALEALHRDGEVYVGRSSGKTVAVGRRRNGRSSIFEAELEYALKMTPGIPPFRCNERVIPGRLFEVDFVWPKEKIALELEGGVWRRGGGAHSHPTNILRDIEKSNLLALEGYRVLRFTTDQHKRGEIVPFLIRFFA